MKYNFNISFILIFGFLFINVLSYNSTLYQDPWSKTYNDGTERCNGFYDQGPNKPEDCTSNKLNDPNAMCCFVNYTVGSSYTNSFCMPLANTSASVGDLKYAFRSADDVEILCKGSILNLRNCWTYLFYLAIILI